MGLGSRPGKENLNFIRLFERIYKMYLFDKSKVRILLTLLQEDFTSYSSDG
jgi:abortive infection bacteriophage resistance protein